VQVSEGNHSTTTARSAGTDFVSRRHMCEITVSILHLKHLWGRAIGR
jgi:hypothetical protein